MLHSTQRAHTLWIKAVSSNAWYYDAVSIAYDYKLILGYDGGIFAPDKKITREEAMAIVVHAMKIAKLKTEVTVDEKNNILKDFNDSSTVSAWAKASVTACVREGIISGNVKSLMAKENISRAQTATIVRSILKKAKSIKFISKRNGIINARRFYLNIFIKKDGENYVH